MGKRQLVHRMVDKAMFLANKTALENGSAELHYETALDACGFSYEDLHVSSEQAEHIVKHVKLEHDVCAEGVKIVDVLASLPTEILALPAGFNRTTIRAMRMLAAEKVLQISAAAILAYEFRQIVDAQPLSVSGDASAHGEPSTGQAPGAGQPLGCDLTKAGAGATGPEASGGGATGDKKDAVPGDEAANSAHHAIAPGGPQPLVKAERGVDPNRVEASEASSPASNPEHSVLYKMGPLSPTSSVGWPATGTPLLMGNASDSSFGLSPFKLAAPGGSS
jgi:hypothetical protein